MSADRQDPIVAIATAPGRGGVGIVRISSPVDVAPLALALGGRVLPAREACYVPFRDTQGQAIDHGLALRFPAPHSYTGEHVLELQGHGGPVVLQLLLARCLEAASMVDPASGQPLLKRLRLARPGEFTERAFLNDKLDLAQAEAVADLIDASTEAAARSAGRSLSGAFSDEIAGLRDALIQLRMLVEATLDFPEEEIDFLQQADAQGQLDRLRGRLDAVRQRARQGALLREGITVVIAGQPNAGKSSLLNALAGAELAIVTPIAGTTRDKVTQTIQIEGVPLHVVDTAGLRASDDAVESIGIARAWDEIGRADAVLFLHDLSRAGEARYDAGDDDIRRTMDERAVGRAVPVLQVWNKSDAVDAALPAAMGEDAIRLSARTGAGLDLLRRRLLEVAGWQSAPEGLYLARERHLQALREVDEHLADAHERLALGNAALDLLAEELRLAQNALGAITGEFGADDLLGVIFSRFCIGK
ncbi:tRNA uridine-5-carboxymethylaminomethyl(34) synthesis GTPase MnmE [Xylophilus sp. GOD-11R]|uniref:tRNA uridine-5-carboxymethylaminomethyl(34) synthesis GTPase MnmE n=1 Tax=Xylophilus sp. GOD-11R TaxID=3089814 RepID=UPI00298BCAD3|nr:tRNA uridine-5-carboxymethylaminomethyl(34) synthesis GTPase MnmE [Xylophilus sp. GOD-11R]WPB57048.1 tRNA uridine-5-carboxymethylaminomethyl(34) synthesis GTPase MnmE [Xylophilus sp. GOD-11R]